MGQATGLNLKEISFSYMDDVVSLFFEKKKLFIGFSWAKDILAVFEELSLVAVFWD